MKTIKLFCKKCNTALTENLTEISESKIVWKEEGNSIPKNCFLIPKFHEVGNILVAVDTYFLNDNPINKDFGCCGNSNHKSYNKTCANGHEVATKIADCYTSSYIEFDVKKIIIEEIN